MVYLLLPFHDFLTSVERGGRHILPLILLHVMAAATGRDRSHELHAPLLDRQFFFVFLAEWGRRGVGAWLLIFRSIAPFILERVVDDLTLLCSKNKPTSHNLAVDSFARNVQNVKNVLGCILHLFRALPSTCRLRSLSVASSFGSTILLCFLLPAWTAAELVLKVLRSFDCLPVCLPSELQEECTQGTETGTARSQPPVDRDRRDRGRKTYLGFFAAKFSPRSPPSTPPSSDRATVMSVPARPHVCESHFACSVGRSAFRNFDLPFHGVSNCESRPAAIDVRVAFFLLLLQLIPPPATEGNERSYQLRSDECSFSVRPSVRPSVVRG